MNVTLHCLLRVCEQQRSIASDIGPTTGIKITLCRVLCHNMIHLNNNLTLLMVKRVSMTADDTGTSLVR